MSEDITEPEVDKLDELFGDRNDMDETCMDFKNDSEGLEMENQRLTSPDEKITEEQTSGRRRRTLSDVRTKQMEVRKLVAPRDIRGNPLLLKLPGFMGINQSPYTAAQVLEEELGVCEDSAKDEAAKSFVLLHAATTMRWLRDPKTNSIRTNAHLVKWSDNSWSIMVGDELFEISVQSMAAEHNYIYGRHVEEGSMECLGKLNERIMIRPYITVDQGHRKYLAAAAVASAKASADVRVKMAVTIADPEREKQRMIKLEQEKIKARRKIEARRRNLKQKSFERVARTGLTGKFLEESDFDEEAEYDDDFIDDTNVGEEGGEEEEATESLSEPESEFSSHSESGAEGKDRREQVRREHSDDNDGGGRGEGEDKEDIITRRRLKRSRKAPILEDENE